MVNKADTQQGTAASRHKRVRGKISGTAERPRLNVFRSSSQHLRPDHRRHQRVVTLCAASTLDKEL